MTTTTLSYQTQRALTQLKILAPTGGWAVECRGSEVRLLRRNVPLTDGFFTDLYLEPTAGRIVGIQSTDGRGQVLIDPSGKPQSVMQVISCPSYHPRETPRGTTPETSTRLPLSDEENKKLILYGSYAVAVAILGRMLLQAVFTVYILAFPIIYFYGISTCPIDETFDAKQQLKRVMRGHHLPNDHPDKPKGLFHTTMAKWTATLATELSTSLGYEVRMYHVMGVCTIARVTVPSVHRTFVWVGMIHSWRYLYSQELDEMR